MAYSRPRVGGIIAMNLAEDDELIAARITDGTMNVFLGRRQRQVDPFSRIRCAPHRSRVAVGVRGMTPRRG